jgi:hypothetical protein
LRFVTRTFGWKIRMNSYEKIPEMPDHVPSRAWARIKRLLLVAVIGLAGWGSWRLVVAHNQAASQEEVTARASVLGERLRAIQVELSLESPGDDVGRHRALIEEAVATQNELMRLQPNADRQADIRLHEWQSKLGELDVTAWSRESRDLEAKAQTMSEAGRAGESIDLMKEALALQQKINASFANRALKNYGRETRLQQEVERLEAEPLLAEVRRLMEEARIATDDGRWQDAITSYEAAREQQQSLNRDYARTRFASVLAVERIEAELATLGAIGLNAELQAALTQAGIAADEGKIEAAEASLATAEERQHAINVQYPKSRFVSTERFAQIEVTRQTLRARVAVQQAQQLDARASAHLQRRELFQAQKLIAEALQTIESIAVNWPKASGMDEALKQRLSYLHLRQAEIVRIQDQVYDLLAPLPGGQVSLLKTEVPQSLYLRVMNNNPSRNTGPSHAVDSVTFAEAEEFCRRLSWVLGRGVRLPTQAEFALALGKPEQNAAPWGSETSSGRSHPVGQKAANVAGFHDLLGNVAEWLAESSETEAKIAGGSYADALAGTTSLPVMSVSKTARARTTGFRVIVEMNPASP